MSKHEAATSLMKELSALASTDLKKKPKRRYCKRIGRAHRDVMVIGACSVRIFVELREQDFGNQRELWYMQRFGDHRPKAASRGAVLSLLAEAL